MKTATIKQVVEGILSQPAKDEKLLQTLANEAVIYYKTAMICESRGIDEAMKYYTGTHILNEYQEFIKGANEE